MNLLTKIELLNLRIRDEVEFLNSGGCGIFCYLMYKRLLLHDIQCEIAALDVIDINAKKTNISNYLNNGTYTKDMVCRHFVLKVEVLHLGNLFFDGYHVYLSEQELTDNGYGYIKGYYTIDEMEVALNYGGWNNSYEKSDNQTLVDCIKSVF